MSKTLPEALEATEPKPRPKRHRVDNDIGLLIDGRVGRRVVLLVSCKALGDLAEVPDLWCEAKARALRVVLGVVEISRCSDEITKYTVVTICSREGYSIMLKEISSGIAHAENAHLLDFLGTPIRPRPWGPFFGSRRRGGKALHRLMVSRGLAKEHKGGLTDVLRQEFLLRMGGAPT